MSTFEPILADDDCQCGRNLYINTDDGGTVCIGEDCPYQEARNEALMDAAFDMDDDDLYESMIDDQYDRYSNFGKY